MQKYKWLVVLDADRILLDFERRFIDLATSIIGRPIGCERRVYPVTERYGISREESTRMWETLDAAGWTGFDPMPGSMELVRHLQESGSDIHVVTCIDPCHRDGRLADLRKTGLDLAEDHLHCVGRQVTKELHFCTLEPDVVIDDDVVHIHAAIRQGASLPIWVHHGDIGREAPTWSDFEAVSVENVAGALDVLRCATHRHWS